MARLLLEEPNLLILDEPTNHLISRPLCGWKITSRTIREHCCWYPMTAISSTGCAPASVRSSGAD
ncbi:MAG: hypothetical protein ACLSFT_06580 [Ruminococcus callidus]